MKKQFLRWGSLLLSASFLIVGLGSFVLATDPGTNTEKEETVYVITDPAGSPNEVIVSDWLKNPEEKNSVKDYSELQNIEVVKGDASSSGSGKDLIWSSDGQDVYYQGTSSKELPVGVNMTYLLDGKEIPADDLAGKSGTLTIRIQYQNHTEQTVEIDGQEVSMSVPFLMASGLIFDNDTCRDLTVDHGMVENDGDRSIVLCYGMPGLSKSLARTDSEETAVPDLPDTVEITAEVTDFHLETVVTAASCSFLNDLDLDQIGSLDELETSLNDLEDAAQALLDGTGELLDGTVSLQDGTTQLQEGAKTLSDGAGALDSGAGDLSTGASSLSTGAASLSSSMGTLAAGIGSAYAGSQNLSGGLSQLKTGADDLASGLAQLQVAAAALQSGLSGQSSAGVDPSGVLQNAVSVEQQAIAALQALDTDGTYADLIASLQTSAQNEAAILSAYESTPEVPGDVTTLVGALKTGIDSAAAGATQLSSGLSGAETGASQLTAGLGAAVAGSTQLCSGAKALADGASSLESGSLALKSGTAQLSQGAVSLYDGTEELADGVKQLHDGAAELQDGMLEFQEEGIEKLTGLYWDNIPALMDRLRALQSLGQDYRNFSGLAKGAEGSVKFLFRSEAIAAEK